MGTRRVGHAGTLDPFATGLLVVLVGLSTRLARFVESETKVYHTVVQLGTSTDSDDGTGNVTAEVVPPRWPEQSSVAEALASLTGVQLQRPPAFSAKHVDGTRSYKLARRGEAVELPECEINVEALELLEYTPPTLSFRATVGKGTYLRSLARDLGAKLGLPAHCAQLRRTAIGRFTVDEAVDPREARHARLLPPADVVAHLPTRILDEDELVRVRHGRTVAQEAEVGGSARLVASDGRLIAVAEGREGMWHPVVVMETTG